MDIENLSTKVVALKMKGEWVALKNVMESIFLEKGIVEIVAELANRLPNSTFEIFFLNGLLHMSQLNACQFKRLFSLLSDKPLGLYNLERLLVGYGGITRKDFHEMAGNLDYKETCVVDGERTTENNVPVRIMTHDEYVKMMCMRYEIPIDTVVAFRKNLKSVLQFY